MAIRCVVVGGVEKKIIVQVEEILGSNDHSNFITNNN